MKHVAVLMVALAASSVVGLGSSQEPQIEKIFVFTAVETDRLTPARIERQLLVDALKKNLTDSNRIPSQVRMVDARDEATIVLEVASAVPSQQTMLLPRDEQIVSASYAVHARLTFGSNSTDVTAKVSQPSYRTSAVDRMAGRVLTAMRVDAARSLTDKILEWIATNDADLRQRK